MIPKRLKFKFKHTHNPTVYVVASIFIDRQSIIFRRVNNVGHEELPLDFIDWIEVDSTKGVDRPLSHNLINSIGDRIGR